MAWEFGVGQCVVVARGRVTLIPSAVAWLSYCLSGDLLVKLQVQIISVSGMEKLSLQTGLVVSERAINYRYKPV